MHKYIFTDTNLFEQFQPITGIDWLALASCDSATLLVPSVTLRELNEHKDGATRGRLKRRAAAALIDLKKYSDQGTPAKIRDGVDLDFRVSEPLIDFAQHHLDERLNDDRLIASAIEFATERMITAECVLVATGDFGLELKVKSQSLLRSLPLPEALRLPDEVDAEEKQIRDLREELGNYQTSLPNLDLAFEDASRFTTVQIEEPKTHELGSPEGVVADLEQKYPYLAPHPGHPQNGRWVFCDVGEHHCQQYNNSLNQFFQRTEHWVRESERIQNWYRTSTVLDLFIQNSGGAPGTDIDVELRFPPPVRIVSEGRTPRIPAQPIPPLRPNEPNRTAPQNQQSSIPEDFDVSPVSRDGKSRLSRIDNAGGGSVVAIHVSSVKHTYRQELPRLLTHFHSFEEAKSFGFDYRIVAENHPKPVEGHLDVVVEKR
jgi:hypothetical protein